jgi:hypothetical protein
MTIQSDGGKARAAKLTKERRVEIARLAAAKRWAPKPDRILVQVDFPRDIWAAIEARAKAKGIRPGAWMVRLARQALIEVVTADG